MFETMKVPENVFKDKVEELFNEAHNDFIKQGGIFLSDSVDGDNQTGYSFEFSKDMNVVISTRVDNEETFDPELKKAESIEEAWEASKDRIRNIIEGLIHHGIFWTDEENFEDIDWSFTNLIKFRK